MSERENTETQKTVRIKIDPNSKDPLADGLGAVQKLFEGLVKSAQNAVGPELMRNASASGWLSQVATTIEAVAKSLRAGTAASPEATGELLLFSDRLDDELTGSKLASQADSLRQRLSRVVELASASPSAAAATEVAITAGYFSAAARTASPNLSALGATPSDAKSNSEI
jgi:hypothetical protein